jgi:hypothetical protein
MQSVAVFLRNIREKEFGTENEDAVRFLLRKVRTSLQDICFTYRSDPNYSSLTAPFTSFLETSDAQLRKILSTREPPVRRASCVSILESIIELTKTPQSFETDFKEELQAVIESGIPPAVLKTLTNVPGDDFEAEAAKVAGDEFQNKAIRYSAWTSIVKMAPYCTGLNGKLAPAQSLTQKQIANLKAGPMVLVDRELTELNRKIQTSKNGQKNKRAALEEIAREFEKIEEEARARKRKILELEKAFAQAKARAEGSGGE